MGIQNTINTLARAAAGIAIATSAFADDASIEAQITTDNPQIAACIAEAIDAVEIEGAEEYFYAPHNIAKNDLLINADAGELNSDGWTHGMGVSATLRDSTGPDYSVSFATYHEGSLDENVIDGVNAGITLKFNTDSNTIVSRFSGLNVDDFGTSYSDTAHGQWVVDSVQTLEATFSNCMEMKASAERPANAATSVAPAPGFIPKTPTGPGQ